MKLYLDRKRKLFYSALLFMLTLSIIPLLFIYFLLSTKYHRYIVDNIFEQQLNTINITSRLISNYFNNLESTLFFASALYMQQIDKRNSLLTILRNTKSHIEDFIVYKNNKFIFVSSKNISKKDKKIIFDLLTRKDKPDSGKVRYGDIYIDLKNLIPYIFAEIKIGDTHFILKANMNIIWDTLLKLKRKKTEYIEILNKNYKIIAASDIEKIFAPKCKIPDNLIRLIRNKYVSGTTLLKIDNIDYFTSFSYINKLEWYIIIYQEKDIVMHSLYQIKRLLLYVLISTILMIILLSAIVFYNIDKRIKKFIISLQEIAHGNFDKKIEIEHYDELGEIGDAINKMAEELKNNIHKIRDMELEKKKMEEINALKTDFFSMITHDLKTPLAALSGTIDLFLRGSLGNINDEQEKFLGYAKKSIDELFDMVNLILDIGKMENGNFNFSFIEFNILILINDLVKHLSPIFDDKGLKVNLDFDKNYNGFIVGDASQIKRVLMNLLNNAIKFSPPNSSIDIRVEKKDNKCIISITDYGKGIPEEDIDKIFDKYYQSKNSVKGGTGLGLTLAKLVVEAHNGKIYAESELNKYTKFIIELPESQDEEKN